MSFRRIDFHRGGLHLPELGLWLDPHEPCAGPERAFVSHAHSDHVAPHREVILSAPTARLMQARMPGVRHEHVLEFGMARTFPYRDEVFQITLLPAGHIFGSAMALIEEAGQSLLYTGDFKLRRGLSAEACEPRRADILIMETTFGRPEYQFPPTPDILKGVVRFCRESLDNDETPVLLGYSLGKSQELLCGLADAGLPLVLHDTVWKLTQIYQQFGQCFPPHERYAAGSAHGKVLLCPPHVAGSSLVRSLGKARTAILTGWAVDASCRYRYRCDAAFPLSDHADFPDLVRMVELVQPRQVYTLHGFAADFANTLRQLGYNAQALSEDEQFVLPLEEIHRRREIRRPKEVQSSEGAVGGQEKTRAGEARESASVVHGSQGDPEAFVRFAVTCSRIGGETRKLEKIRILAEYLRELRGVALGLAANWFTGRPFPASQNKVLQLGWAVLRDALCEAGQIDAAAFHQVYLKHSDLGETACEILEPRGAAPSLRIAEAGEVFQKLHAARGPLAKTPLLTAAFERCAPIEAKYLVKIITGDLRIGLKEGLVEEAVASAFSRPAEEVRNAHLLLGDIGETARLAAENRLSEATLVPFRPVRFMLASPEPTAAAIWERVQAWGSLPEAAAWLEDKYDGVRCQLHKVGRQVALFSRDAKEITTTFLELADTARGLTADFILDGEIVAMRGEEVLPFAELQKRLGRRQGDLFMREEVPIKFVAFDLLWLGGRSYLERPLRERRQALESLAEWPECFALARITQARSVAEVDAAFDAARERGNEGLMIKDPASVYAPGRRGLAWLKLKKAFATLDCVVVGAEYGHGKRSRVLSDYTFAVRDDASGEMKIIGKAYTGLTDAEIAQLTEHFLKTAVRQQGRFFEVPPDTVLEVAFDKLQPSNRHSSGLAMRFPRILRLRPDKTPAEIDTLATARRLVR